MSRSADEQLETGRTGVGRLLALLLAARGRPFGLIVLALVALLFATTDPEPLQRLRLAAFDSYQRLDPRVRTEHPVVVVDIDEHSLGRYGQWPWPRTLIADLLSAIGEQQPLAIGFDILFPEPDRMSPDVLAITLPGLDEGTRGRLAALPSNDAVLAGELSRYPTVLGQNALEFERPEQPQVPRDTVEVDGIDPSPHLPQLDGLLHSVPELDNAARGHGILNALLDYDGVIRRVLTVARVGDHLQPALAVEMLRLAVGARAVTVHGDQGGMTGFSVGDISVPTGPNGQIWLHHRFYEDVHFVSAAEVLEGDIAPDLLSSRFVLVAATGQGLVDRVSSPLGERIFGVEIHAQLLEMIIDYVNDGVMLPSRPQNGRAVEIKVLVAAGLLLVALTPMVPVALSLLPALLIISLELAAGVAAFRELRLLYDPTTPVLGSAAVFVAMVAVGLVEGERRRRALQQRLAAEREAQARLAGELDAARRIQMGILPDVSSIAAAAPWVDVHPVLIPATTVGGDLYDFHLADDGQLFFLIGDVSGKGVPASLFMAISKALCRSVVVRRPGDIDAILAGANREIGRENPESMFVTVFAGLLDLHTGEVRFCNAGHDAPFLVGADGAARQVESEGGPPLCVVEDFPYPRETCRLQPGDTLLLYTDGVSEAVDGEGRFYTTDRLAGLLRGLERGRGAEAVVQAILNDVADFVGEAEPADDITILAITWKGATPAEAGTTA